MKHSIKNRNNTDFIILEGIAFTVILNLYNPFLLMFAKRMGAQNIHIALLSSMPPLVAILVLIPFGILIERANRKKKTVLLMISLISIFYLSIAFVPLIPDRAKMITYVVLIGLMNGPGSLYLATWQSFFADTFSSKEINRVYSLRSKYGAFFGLLTVLLTGLALTEIPKTDGERLVIYQAFYFACFIFSLLQIYFLSRVKEQTDMPSAKGNSSSLTSFGKRDIKEMFRNKNFIVFCICVFVFHITWQMGWPLFFIYNVDYAKLDELQIGIVTVAMGLAQFLTFSFWGKLIEKKGSRIIIIFGAFGLSVTPLFCVKLVGFFPLVMINIFSGIAIACFTLSLFTSLIETLPGTKKTLYTSVFNTFINISGFISPLIGVWIYSLINIYSSMFLIGVLRFIAAGLFVYRWWSWNRKQGCSIVNGELEV